MEINPYAAPQSQVLQSTTQDGTLRKEHINTEAAIKSVGTLYYLGAFITCCAGLFLIITGLMRGNDAVLVSVAIGGIALALGIGQGFLAHGLRTLQSWVRIPTIILSCIGLFALGLGTLINIYILVKVGGQKGRFVLSPDYQRIIAATPHVKYKTSAAAWIILIVLLLILLGIGIMGSVSQ